MGWGWGCMEPWELLMSVLLRPWREEPTWKWCQYPKSRWRENLSRGCIMWTYSKALSEGNSGSELCGFSLHESNSPFCLAQFGASVLLLATKNILTDTHEMVFLWLPSLGQTPVCQWPSYQSPRIKPIILDGDWLVQVTEGLSWDWIRM